MIAPQVRYRLGLKGFPIKENTYKKVEPGPTKASKYLPGQIWVGGKTEREILAVDGKDLIFIQEGTEMRITRNGFGTWCRKNNAQKL